MPATSDLKPLSKPTTLITMHCPALICRHLAIARSTAAAVEALSDHIARVHGALVRPA